MGYALHWEVPLGVVKRFHGLVTGKDVLASVVEVESSEHFDDLRYVINDFRDATGTAITALEVDEIAAIDRAAARTNPRIHIAVVATLPEIVAASRHYADSPMTCYPTRAFTTLAEARAWLEQVL